MCGIIGICYLDRKEIGEFLYRGLLRLEYRGYDSAGIAVISNGKLTVLKGKGKLVELENRFNFTNVFGVIGIGHTRWATHGAPSDNNAHPHLDCSGLFAVVHNGIIENYYEVREELIRRGHLYRSETDTEVLPHLLEEYYVVHGDVYRAFKEAIKRLKGAYAVLMITPLESNKIFFARRESPLVIGLADGYNVIASDIPALLDHTKRIIVIRDNWVGYITPREVYIEDLSLNEIIRYGDYVKSIEWSTEDASKETYPHFMLKEIYEQPRALIQTLAGLRGSVELKKATQRILEAETIYITGAGTSYHASEFFSTLFTLFTGRRVLSFIASEYDVYARAVGKRDLLIAVSQSGETIDVLKAVRSFKDRGIDVLTVTNIVDSTVARESDIAIYTRAGPEIGVAATKTFLTQTLVFSWITLEYSRYTGIINEDDYMSLRKYLETSSELVRDVIDRNSAPAEELSEMIINTRSMYCLSRGIGVPVAKEGALKIKEIAYIHAEAYPAGESKHGPIALVEPGYPVIFIVPRDSVLENKLAGNIEEMKARGAFTIGVIPRSSRLRDLFDFVFEVPDSHWITTPLTHTPPLQLLAYYLAVKRGYDPDKPRNLAKTVTVE